MSELIFFILGGIVGWVVGILLCLYWAGNNLPKEVKKVIYNKISGKAEDNAKATTKAMH